MLQTVGGEGLPRYGAGDRMAADTETSPNMHTEKPMRFMQGTV